MNSAYNKYKSELDNYISSLVYKDTPELLKESMSYSLNLPCKRVRGVLTLASYNLLKPDYNIALPFAAAIEMIHCYSLIHDDLPAMDNDDLRRGMPSNHIKFGEDIAILAGDALLNYAFETMLEFCIENNYSKEYILAMSEIAKRAGVSGMIAGQIADITFNADSGNKKTLEFIHSHKTSDMLIASISAGLFLAGATERQVADGQNYAFHLGMAFQIIDDILDFTSSSDVLGKSIGKDQKNNKLSWVTLNGIDKAKNDAKKHTLDACNYISNGFENSKFLEDFAMSLLERVS